MRVKFTKALVAIGAIAAITFIYINGFKEKLGAEVAPIEEEKMSLRDRVDLAYEQEFERTKDLEIDRIPRERLREVYERIREQERYQRRGKAAIGGVTWVERGPSNVGGRTRVLLFDANDATHKTVFAGSVAGGLWKTTDIFASEVEWTKINDFFDNMAITALAQDPTNPNIMYFGTGEGYFNSDAVRGDGVWKSTDGGATWTQLSATTGSTNYSYDYVTKIIVDGSGNVIVGTKSQYINHGGVYRSTNGGTSFTEVLERYTASGGSEYDRCADLEMAADGKTFYAAMGIFSSDGIYKSTDSAKTWTRVYDAHTPDEERIDIVCAPSNSSYVYALVQENDNTIKKIMKSIDGGTTWTTCGTITWYDQCGSTASTDFTRNQAWYNLVGAVDPNDEKIFYVAGINIFRSVDTGTTWSQLSSWVGCGGYSEVHSDHHALEFFPGSSDTMINGNDGGVYISKNTKASPPTWTPVNNGYNVTQFYAGAMHPTALENYFLTGSQDNGSQRFQSAGVNVTDEVTGGDGGFCHIDQEDPDTQITAYTNNNIRISTNGFSTYTSYSSSVGNFINASDYDSDNKILYAGSGNGQLYRWSNIGGTPSTTNYSISHMNSSQASAILVSPSTPTTVYVGTEDGNVIKVTSASTSPSSDSINSGLPTSGTVSCIAEDPNDATHLLVTYSNYGMTSVYETTNGGTSWSSVEGDLPDMPVRWALFSPIGGDSAMLATEVGVWSTTNLNGGSTAWTATNTGLANCRVDMLQYRPSDSLVLAATHGRGMYTTNVFSERVTPQFEAEDNIVYEGDEVQFYDDSYGATSWSWDFDNDGNAESTLQNPTFTFGEGGLHTVKLTINGSTSTTNTIQVLPKVAVPYTTADGGDMESNAWHFGGVVISGDSQLWERGGPSGNYFSSSHHNGSNAWVTGMNRDMVDLDMECALLTPSFNFTSTASSYTLSFVKSMEIRYCNGPIAARVEYSTDQGDTWTRLGSDDGTGTNWYNRGANNSCDVSEFIFADSTGWVGNYTKSTSSYDVSFLNGNSDVRFRILYEVSDNFSSGFDRDGFLVDDFAISGPANDAISGAGIETAIFSRTMNLPANDSAHYYSNNGKLLASIWNQSTHNFGATTVEIDATGTSAEDFDTKTAAADRIFSKTIKITPTTNNTSASVKIAMYYTAAELSGWQSVVGQAAEDVQLFKTTNAIASSTIAQGVLPSATVIDSSFNGSDLCVIGTFSNGFSGVGAGGGGGGGGGPLPVTLLNFTAERQPTQVNLSWSTASETNNSHFEILRSVNGGDFNPIGRVAGNGTTTNLAEYEFVDLSDVVAENNTLCYQLKQVDYDGAYEMSPIECASNNQVQQDIVIGPNPASKFMEVSIDPWSSYNHSIDIVDMKGNVIYSKSSLKAQNRLDISALSSGAYFVAIKRDGVQVQVEKIIKE